MYSEWHGSLYNYLPGLFYLHESRFELYEIPHFNFEPIHGKTSDIKIIVKGSSYVG